MNIERVIRQPHGVIIHARARRRTVSGWFDAAGVMLDCEKIDSLNRSRRPNQYERETLEIFGRLQAL